MLGYSSGDETVRLCRGKSRRSFGNTAERGHEYGEQTVPQSTKAHGEETTLNEGSLTQSTILIKRYE